MFCFFLIVIWILIILKRSFGGKQKKRSQAILKKRKKHWQAGFFSRVGKNRQKLLAFVFCWQHKKKTKWRLFFFLTWQQFVQQQQKSLKLRVVACEVVRSGFQFFSCLHCPKKKTWRQMKKKLTLLDHQKTFEDNFQNKIFSVLMSALSSKWNKEDYHPT